MSEINKTIRLALSGADFLHSVNSVPSKMEAKAIRELVAKASETCEWKPIETAPKGGGAELVTDPKWVEPPSLLLLFAKGKQVVCHWDWYYAEGGCGHRKGYSAWVEPISGEQIALHLDEPTHWMPLPKLTEIAAKQEEEA